MSTAAIAPNGRPLAEVYRAAAARVRAGWTTGRYFLDSHGKDVLYADEAIACCALGALFSCAVSRHRDATGFFDESDGVVVARPLVAALASAGEIVLFDDEGRPIDPAEAAEDVADGRVDPNPDRYVGENWNDRKGQTAREVATWLDRVAGELEKGGAT